MERITMTPFGRQQMAVGQLVATLEDRSTNCAGMEPKWQLFHDLTAARTHFNINDRDLSVLNALLTFYPSDTLGGGNMIVFPSNNSLSQRAHGMPESTLRRHLAKLIASGLIQRHDSPNGKRYARRNVNGQINRAFGFDLTPMLRRAGEIRNAMYVEQERVATLAALREECVLAMRDADKLVLLHPDHDTKFAELKDVLRMAHKGVRRKPDLHFLTALRDQLVGIIDMLLPQFQNIDIGSKTLVLSANDDQSERHYHNSKAEIYRNEEKDGQVALTVKNTDNDPIPVCTIVGACPDIKIYCREEIRSFQHLLITAESVSGMMGIAKPLWLQAIQTMGPNHATATIAALLQRIKDIRSPSAYLRMLIKKAQIGAYTPGAMLRAIVNTDNNRAGLTS